MNSFKKTTPLIKALNNGKGLSSVLLNYSLSVFNVLMALFLLVLSLPIFILIAIAIRHYDNGPILYAHTRLGRNKKKFMMYKFRSLPIGSDQKIGAEILSTKHLKLRCFQKFLRESRLDELPQLINIIKRDMDFIGPRPLRNEIYESMCKQIYHFDRRFWVKPGLIGYSQLFTPPGTPKRIRALIDNHFIQSKYSYIKILHLISMSIYACISKIFLLICDRIKIWFETKIIKRYHQKRIFDRVKHKTAYVGLDMIQNISPSQFPFKLVDINESHFKIVSNERLGTHENKFKIKLVCSKKSKKKHAQVNGKLFASYPTWNKHYKYIYVIEYKAISPLNQYMIDQYFLKKSFLSLT